MSGRVKRFWSAVLVLAAGAALIQIDGVVASGLGAAALYVGAGVVVMPPRFRISTRRAVAIALGLLGAIAIGVLVPASFSIPTPEMNPLNAVVGNACDVDRRSPCASLVVASHGASERTLTGLGDRSSPAQRVEWLR